MKQLEILNAARERGIVVGHDGAVLPDLMDLLDWNPCPCAGTGRVPVYFGATVIAMIDCPRGCR